MIQDEDIKRFTYMPSDADEAFVTRWIARYENGWADGSCAGFEIRGLDDDAYLGFAAIVHLDLADGQGEIGYMLAPQARGRGAASAAVSLLTEWGLEQLGLERLELRIDVANAASARVAERAGYRLDGVLRSVAFKEGRRVDTAVWSRLRGDRLTA
jgi:RimJ/RimL family protein N-acetyltransferase